MPSHPHLTRSLATSLRLPGGLVLLGLALLGLALLAAASRPVAAQDRRYLFEVGLGGGYTGFDSDTRLGGGAGVLGRIGLWLPYRFSVEGEGMFSSPKAEIGDTGVSVRTLSAALLYNIFLGSASSAYLKVGGGGTKYGSNCPTSLDAPAPGSVCGSTSAVIGGLGVRFAATPTVMIRGEAAYLNNRGKVPRLLDTTTVTFSNFGVNLGVNLMLGSKPLPDSDRDGVLDTRDQCANTPAGAQVDARGCPSDPDGDGVPTGVDRCANTPAGATVGSNGCPRDSDGDNIVDGVDRCPDTEAGVLVDPRGCPRDSDRDQIPDGLDRCSDTPLGATVDALGCPGDEDVDGVLDGLDRCPRSPTGAAVDSRGCAAGQTQEQRGRPPAADTAAPPPARDTVAPAPRAPAREPAREPPPRPAERAPEPRARRAPAPPPTGPVVLEGVTFTTGSARLEPTAYSVLDSVAQVLQANPTVRVEIAGHTANVGSAADNLHLSTLMAESVRNYLLQKGVGFDQVTARGYGGTRPLTPDTTPRGLARNRRVELRPLAGGP